MKNLIVTFQNEKNHGAVFQTYALQTILEKDSDTKILNYDLKRKHNLKSKIIKILTYAKQMRRAKRFKKFSEKYLKLTSKVENISQIEKTCNDFSSIYVGSDQVWAFDIMGLDKDVFFLNFNFKKEIIKNSYAASFGKDKMEENHLQEIKKLLNNFDNISVREESAEKIIRDLQISSVTTVLDPTLLLKKEEYINNFNLKAKSDDEEKYIFVYMLEINPDIFQIVKEVQKRFNYKIICLNNRNYFGKFCECRPDSGPVEFLNLMYNADFVITNSYHGNCFSVIFEKQFISVPHSTKSTRHISLLQRVGLEERLVKSEYSLDNYTNNLIDYKKVNEKLEKHRNISFDFLSKSVDKKVDMNE